MTTTGFILSYHGPINYYQPARYGTDPLPNDCIRVQYYARYNPTGQIYHREVYLQHPENIDCLLSDWQKSTTFWSYAKEPQP